MNNLGNFYWRIGRFSKAEQIHLTALSIRLNKLGINHPDYASSLNNLGLIYVALGEFEKASPYYLESIKIRESKLGKNHPDYATGLMNYAILCKMVDRGQITDCIIDGPLDVFLACDPKSLEIKGVDTPVKGDADVLIFPTLEACNAFYKGLMLFAKGELAGLIQGTIKPVVVMSRSESALSKYYCIALSCLMAD